MSSYSEAETEILEKEDIGQSRVGDSPLKLARRRRPVPTSVWKEKEVRWRRRRRVQTAADRARTGRGASESHSDLSDNSEIYNRRG